MAPVRVVGTEGTVGKGLWIPTECFWEGRECSLLPFSDGSRGPCPPLVPVSSRCPRVCDGSAGPGLSQRPPSSSPASSGSSRSSPSSPAPDLFIPNPSFAPRVPSQGRSRSRSAGSARAGLREGFGVKNNPFPNGMRRHRALPAAAAPGSVPRPVPSSRAGTGPALPGCPPPCPLLGTRGCPRTPNPPWGPQTHPGDPKPQRVPQGRGRARGRSPVL